MATDAHTGSHGRKPPVFGSLGTAFADALGPTVTAVAIGSVLIAILIVALGLPTFVIDLAPTIGYGAAIWTFAVGASIVVVATLAAMAILPPLLSRGRVRAALVVHSWLGGREVRRTLGRPVRIVSALGSEEATIRWLERTPPTDELRRMRFEACLSLGRLDDARAEADRLPRARHSTSSSISRRMSSSRSRVRISTCRRCARRSPASPMATSAPRRRRAWPSISRVARCPMGTGWDPWWPCAR